MLTNRSMEIEDLDEVLRIEELAYTNPWSKATFINELKHNSYSSYLVLLQGDVIVAYGGIWNILDEAHITTIAVDPQYHRQGFGQKMLVLLLEKAVEKGATAITLEVRESNTVAQRLYEKNGFTVGGRRIKYYSDNKEDALVMWNNELALYNRETVIVDE